QIDDEEARVLRLYASGMVTEENWRDLWAEWQDKRQRLRGGLALLDQHCETYISDLDEALNIIAKLGILYETLPHPDQKELLRNVVERVVLNPEGKIIRVDWLPPFAYLQEVSEKVSGGRSSSENLAENQTSGNAGRSSGVLDCGHYRTRTFGSTAFRCMKHQRFSTRRCRFSQRPKLDLNYASQQKSTSETFS